MKFLTLSLCCFILFLAISASSFYSGLKYQERIDDQMIHSSVSTGAVIGMMYAYKKFKDKPSRNGGLGFYDAQPEVDVFTESNPPKEDK